MTEKTKEYIQVIQSHDDTRCKFVVVEILIKVNTVT